jgi:hypothetical protein
MNFIATMPKIMVLDVSFFDLNGKIIKKNFKIPRIINFGDVILPSIDDDVPDVEPRYEIFGAIGFSKQNKTEYYSLVKKKLKKEKKNQWYAYSNGKCEKIKRS